MKKCPKCKTEYIDGSQICRLCGEKLISNDEKKPIPKEPYEGKRIIPVLFGTFGFILFIMLMYYAVSLLMKLR